MKKKFTVLLLDDGAEPRPENAHTEISDLTSEEAVVKLWAFRLKSKPELAIADIDDCGRWVPNTDFTIQKLRHVGWALQREIWREVDQQEDFERRVEVAEMREVPDIRIHQTKRGAVIVYSAAMKCEFAVDPQRVAETVFSLIREYRELVQAGELSNPGLLEPTETEKDAGCGQ